MAEATNTSDVWAFAREGLVPVEAFAGYPPEINSKENPKVDVLTIEFWAKGMTNPAVILQRYEPFSNHGKFILIGEPILVIDGVMRPSDETKDSLKLLNEGISQHKTASGMWNGWLKLK